ncbi:ion transporter [Allokutzneria sp. A3M-2-11 16]|uniref:ion transporter n=1 Tax=Allokutzneria sp. A3M-2-11 16 TaxID=2962043 RepID=UPI0020B8B1B3|nr:ion transporter [Allokutzneria sp. A3M-2-11 16]MCP3801785.1 ion transporter [Allokutzneria sp. A3M-2-11 16]
MPLRERVRALTDGERFQRVIICVIVVNAVVLGLQTSARLTAEYGGLLEALDGAALVIFVGELALRLYAHRLSFFRDPWSCFDFVIVTISLLPASEGLSVIRALRILRMLRLVSMVPSMRRVISALLSAIPGITSLAALLGLLLYVGGVMATTLFQAGGDPRFADLGSTILTLFQITTGDGWSDVMRDVMAKQPLAWIFFVSYLLVGTFTVLNLFIAVVCSAMEGAMSTEPGDTPVPAQRAVEPAEHDPVLGELRLLRQEVQALRAQQPS